VAKPNIVLFLTDDQDVELGSLHAMNRTTALLRDGGATLAAHRVTTPICCPSRVSLLSGRYAHHAGVNYTNASGWCSLGVYWKGPLQNVSLPTYVRAAGYATGLFGKVSHARHRFIVGISRALQLNDLRSRVYTPSPPPPPPPPALKETNANDASTISPGWDRFFALGGTSEGHYYGDWFADQGERYDASDEEYMTDLIANRSLAWIDLQLVAKKPFFACVRVTGSDGRTHPPPHSAAQRGAHPCCAALAHARPSRRCGPPSAHRYIAPHAPHTRATPAPESDGYFVDEIAPRPPSWNASGADKHWMVASQMPLTAKCASASDELYRNRLRALLGVDQLVGEGG
jgi:arylsulfatase A-like enzyme